MEMACQDLGTAFVGIHRHEGPTVTVAPYFLGVAGPSGHGHGHGSGPGTRHDEFNRHGAPQHFTPAPSRTPTAGEGPPAEQQKKK